MSQLIYSQCQLILDIEVLDMYMYMYIYLNILKYMYSIQCINNLCTCPVVSTGHVPFQKLGHRL